MKNFIKIIMIFSFFIGYSQNTNLELYYELGDAFRSISEDDILTQYLVKNIKGETIGRIKQSEDKSKFFYYNLKKDYVAYEYSYGEQDPFALKQTVNVYKPNSRDLLYMKRWNSEFNRYDLVLNGATIAHLVQNKDNEWEVFNVSSSNNIYADIFDVNKEKNIKIVPPKKIRPKAPKPKPVKLPKIKKEIVYPYGFGIYISQDVGLEEGMNSKIRFGAEYHGIFGERNSLGITYGFGKSNTLVSDEYSLTDIDFAVTYGLAIFKLLKLKLGLGSFSSNYDTIESFGPFYDIEGGAYYSAGLQLYIPLDYQGITLDAYTNNYGLSYGIGFKF